MARTRNTTRVLLAVLVATAVLVGGISAATAASTASTGLAPSTGSQECSFPSTVTDATGTDVTIEEEPERVVTTNPSAAQTMKEIGAWDKVVGVTQYSLYLDGAEEKADVTGEADASVEKVVDQEPDLVLVPNATFNPELVDQLRDADLTVYHFAAAESLDDVVEKTRLTGRLVGECDAADRRADRLEGDIETVREAVEGEDRPRVLYVMGPDGYVAAQGTFIHTAIETAGATNIAAERGLTFYPDISDEVVAEEDPEWIVKPTGVDLPDSAAYQGTTAMQEGNVLEVDASHISQPAPRVIRPIRTMAKTFHPEAYAAANATPTETPSPTATETSTATEAETPVDGPGFGLVAGLVAVVLALALRIRD